jgi:ribosomal protein L7/L12
MSFLIYAVLGLFVAAVVVIALKNAMTTPHPHQEVTKSDIQRLVRTGQKIKAIKQYRKLYRTDLRTAKEAIEAMTTNEIRPTQPQNISKSDIQKLALEGKKIEAIKQYRKLYQTDLRTAMEAVEAMINRQ